LIVGWCGQFLFFVVLRSFSKVVGEWLENQILIPDWTYFYCPGATLVPRQFSQVVGEWPENQILIPDWTYFHCPGTTLDLEWTIFIFFCCPSQGRFHWRKINMTFLVEFFLNCGIRPRWHFTRG